MSWPELSYARIWFFIDAALRSHAPFPPCGSDRMLPFRLADHANTVLHGKLTYSKNGGSAVIPASVVLPEVHGFQPWHYILQLFDDIIDDGQHIQAILVTFLKQVDKRQHLQGFFGRLRHCNTNVLGEASLTKPVSLALSMLSWDEFYCPI